MFHPGTQTLIDHWSALPEARRIPSRRDFQPLLLGRLVPQLFSADRIDTGAVFRVAGGAIETLHGQPLRGLAWLGFWAEASRPAVTRAMMQAIREARPVVIVAEAERLRGVVEIVIAPLRDSGGTAGRWVGLYQPIAEQERRTEAVGPLTARVSIGAGVRDRAPLTLASLDGRRIA